MQATIPIGALEDERTEFKRADVLRQLEPISRAVVSMLNAQGGNVWIGAIEQHERWAGVDPIADVERAKRRVEDYLMSSIEPTPRAEELRVEPVEVNAGEHVIVARVEPGKRRPYAHLAGGARHFLLRVGPRTRAMTRDEIARAFREPASSAAKTDALRARSDELWIAEATAALRSGRPEYWIRIAFDPPLELPANARTCATLDAWLHDPSTSGNRIMGWTFASESESFASGGSQVDGFVAGGEHGGTWLEVTRGGEITFRTPLGKLEHGAVGELYPYALVEFPTSLVRLAAAMHREFAEGLDGRVLLDLSLNGAQQMRIRPGMPGSAAYALDSRTIDADIVRPEPHVERVASLRDAPDALAWRALTALYFRLGFLDDRMPLSLYDEQHRRIRFPK